MTELPAYETDAAMCRLLAGGPLPTAAMASRLAMPERTVRYRLTRLRRAGVVVTGPDQLHRLAAETLPALTGPAVALAAGTLPANDDSGREFAASGPTPATIWNVGARVAFVALAVGCAVVLVARHSAAGQPPAQVAPPRSPAWPSGLGWLGPGSW